MEGKSYGWSYPSEVETLKPFVAANNASQKPEVKTKQQPIPEYILPQATAPSSAKKIFVSLPSGNAATSVSLSSSPAQDPIEQKAEELRKRIQSYAPTNPVQPEEVKTNYARSLKDAEEEYTSWMYQKKTKKKKYNNARHWIAAGIVGVGLAGTWLMAKTVYKTPAVQRHQAVVQSQNQQKVSQSDAATKQSSAFPVAENKPSKQSIPIGALKESKKKIRPSGPPKKSEPIITSPAEMVRQEPVRPAENSPVLTEEKNEPVAAEKPKEKKRSLKQLLGGLFGKKNKDETVQEAPKPADNNNNERKATRRDEQATETVAVDLIDQVDIKMNKSSDDWMMGVQGLKLTLYNRSATTLQSAAVQVLYYSEQNNLLDKKTIYFSNIASGKSQTLAAPDHRMADHVEYKIVSAKGMENAYAKQ